MRCIQLGSSVGCSRVPQFHFVRKQTMCILVYTNLTVCFALKPRWLLHNTADRGETVFSPLNDQFQDLSARTISFLVTTVKCATSFPGSLFSASLSRWNRDPGCGRSRDHLSIQNRRVGGYSSTFGRE